MEEGSVPDAFRRNLSNRFRKPDRSVVEEGSLSARVLFVFPDPVFHWTLSPKAIPVPEVN